MTYLLLANFYLGIFYVLYHYLLRRETFFQWNRGYLLTTLPLAYILPLVSYKGFELDGVSYGGVLPQVLIGGAGSSVANHQSELLANTTLSNYPLWLFYAYLAGCCITLAYFTFQLFQTTSSLKQGKRMEAFSFFGVIRVDKNLEGYDRIMQHEQVHARQWHSLDILLIQLVKIFNWFNPMVYLYERAIKLQHEYIADAETAKNDRIEYAELLVSRALHTDGLMLANLFANKLSLHARVNMLLKGESSKNSLLRLGWVIPVVVSMVVFSTACNQATNDNQVAAEDTLIANESEQTPSAASAVASPSNEETTDDSILERPEILPDPPGGMKAFMDYVAKNYKYPNEALEAEVNGIIEVSFVVDKDGSLTDMEIVRDLGHGTGDAAVELLQNGPKWNPGLHNGEPIRTAHTLPIRLNLIQ